jgi:uncharacterized membrane protein YfhO
MREKACSKAARLQKYSSEAATRIQHQYIDSHVDIDKMVGKITKRCESTLAVVDSHGRNAENVAMIMPNISNVC